ncbi:MAG TPA: ornithine cyclodeaminase family protein [Chloroflexota bacterium]|nr:ornithine cyclodeaminase family protein [Chloroflexota bacterium]
MTLLLSAADLARCLDPRSVAGAVERGFAAYSAGATETPLRLAISPPAGTLPTGTRPARTPPPASDPGGVILVMPCAVSGVAGSVAGSIAEGPPALGVKVVSVYPGNPRRGLPTVNSLYLLLDHATGAPLALADGTTLTAARTAAGSAVATRLLARPDATTLGVFGTGVQARAHVLALAPVRAFRRVLVAGTSAEKEAAFVRWAAASTGLPATPADPQDVSGADVLAVCTTSPTPVVLDGAVRPGAHLNAVGAFTPQTRELPGPLVARARVYVDTRAGALAEAGDLLLPAAEGAFDLRQMVGEVGELLLGRIPGRESPADVTIYKSVGAAFLDAVTARLAYERASAGGMGLRFDFAS